MAVLGDSASPTEHRFAIWDGSTWQFSPGTAFSPIRLQGLELGAFDGTAAFKGIIDDVRIYDRAVEP